jgi:hypothetical protein
MSRFVCNLCNRSFTTKYGLQKHSDKKIPCNFDKKTKYKCNVCNKYLSSKQNLDGHLFNHSINNIQVNIEKNNLIDNNLEDNIIHNNSIEITIEEYNYFRNQINSLKDELNRANGEINKLKDENKKLNTMVNTTINNITNNNIDNSIDNSITNNTTNNIQINIIPFHDASINFNDVIESFKDPNSALYDFSKIFNYDHLCHCIGIAFFWVKPFYKRLSNKMD